jgi:predicted nucleic acid-binding protein
MMNIFVDTNVLMDVLTKREPHYQASAVIWTLCEEGRVAGHISVISFNNIFYIVRKLKSAKAAQGMMGLLRDVFRPVELDGQLLNQAIGAGIKDFEDAIQFHSAVRCGAEFLITRNVGHFPKAGFPVVTPEEFLAAKFSGE